eukprot:scaffold43917_cov27-Tisochrysis_lutea.AAC.2
MCSFTKSEKRRYVVHSKGPTRARSRGNYKLAVPSAGRRPGTHGVRRGAHAAARVFQQGGRWNVSRGARTKIVGNHRPRERDIGGRGARVGSPSRGQRQCYGNRHGGVNTAGCKGRGQRRRRD